MPVAVATLRLQLPQLISSPTTADFAMPLSASCMHCHWHAGMRMQSNDEPAAGRQTCSYSLLAAMQAVCVALSCWREACNASAAGARPSPPHAHAHAHAHAHGTCTCILHMHTHTTHLLYPYHATVGCLRCAYQGRRGHTFAFVCPTWSACAPAGGGASAADDACALHGAGRTRAPAYRLLRNGRSCGRNAKSMGARPLSSPPPCPALARRPAFSSLQC